MISVLLKIINMKYLITALTLLIFSFSYTQELNEEEQKLYEQIMELRKESGLPEIPLSKSLTIVAQTHVKDLTENDPEVGNCNMHSWSDKGEWSSCCYTDDHAKASCMWDKPSELTNYKGNGYEIATRSGGGITAEEALQSWIDSQLHLNVILNVGMWSPTWNAIGIGIYDDYSVIWFGNKIDPEQ